MKNEIKPEKRKKSSKKSSTEEITDGIYIDMATKKSAEQLKADIVGYGVPEELITIKRKQKSYRIDITDSQNQMPKIVRMLSSKEYGMSLEEIQKLFDIKLTL